MKFPKAVVCLFCTFFCSIIVNGQHVTNTSFRQNGLCVEVTYTLDIKSDISLFISFDGGTSFQGPLKCVSGDVGSGINPGTNLQIIWNAAEEMGEVTGNNICFKVNASGFLDIFNVEMVYVEGGSFYMGADDGFNWEGPRHKVSLHGFYISKYEVTQKLWKAIMGNNPGMFKGDDYPVDNVSWEEIQEFITKLNEITGMEYRLPTEAEWEFAARGGRKSKGYKYAGSDTIGDVAWYESNSAECIHAVGTKNPNELGIYDMSGSVWEWCHDRYGKYTADYQKNPKGSPYGVTRVIKGGSWHYSPAYCRPSYRSHSESVSKINDVGFRLAISSPN